LFLIEKYDNMNTYFKKIYNFIRYFLRVIRLSTLGKSILLGTLLFTKCTTYLTEIIDKCEIKTKTKIMTINELPLLRHIF